MDLKKLSEPLTIEDVEFRVQSINKGGYATILVYKDARVDMNRLDSVAGRGFWKREHFTIGSSMYCRVSIFNKDINEWVSMEDVGTPSNTEKEKGLSSDAFKRACTNWGIGRELYAYPNMQIKLNSNEFEIYKDNNNRDRVKATYNLKLKQWTWFSVFEKDKIIKLLAKDEKGKERFSFGVEKKKNEQPKGEIKKEKVKQDIKGAKHAKTIVEWIIDNGYDLDKVKANYNVSDEQLKKMEQLIDVVLAEQDSKEIDRANEKYAE